jgi:hypothetical protein
MPATVHPGITAGALTGLVAAFGLIGGIARSLWKAVSEAQRNAARIEATVIKVEEVIREVDELKTANAQQDIALAAAKAVQDYIAAHPPDTRPAPG